MADYQNTRIEELKNRGLRDNKIIEDLICSEAGRAMPKKLKNEMYDKVNYLCRKYMDRMAHFALDYDFKVDSDAFKQVMVCLFEANPVLHSSFIVNPVKPFWRVKDYNIDEVVTVIKTDNPDKAADEFQLQCIPVNSNVQLKAALIYYSGSTRIALVWNHMCSDGGGFKSFFSEFCEKYSDYILNGKSPVFVQRGSRSYKEVYKDFSKESCKKARKLLTNSSARVKRPIPFSPKSPNDKPTSVRFTLNNEVFLSALKKAKELGATANDLICAAYIDAVREITATPENEPVSISCAVDLRRHIKNPDTLGITNHTTFMKCTVPNAGKSFADTISAVAECNRKNKEDEFIGLHGLPLLDFAYCSMVYAQAELVVGLFYNNAPLSVSNMGRISPDIFALAGNCPVSAYVLGAVKNKPCSAVNTVTINNKTILSVCFRGNDKDREIADKLFRLMEQRLSTLKD